MYKWLDKLNREEIDRFLVNLANYNSKEGADEYLNREHKTAFGFLGEAFIWNDTPEGQKYWEDILDKMEK